VALEALAAVSYDPLVKIHLGPLSISPHGIGTAAGFLAGAWLFFPAARRRGMPDELVHSILTRAIIGALVGARLFYVLNNLSDFQSPLEWLRIWEGGISLLGGITGAILAALPVLRGQGWRFLQVMDAAVPGLAVGIAIGRVGDLVIADHLGARTSLPFGYRCPDVVDVGRTVGSPCPPGEVVHLTALYDLVAVSVVLAIALVVRRRARWEGTTTLVAAIAYGIGRFTFDFLREDVRRLGLTGSQWVGLSVVAIAAVVLWRRRPTRRNADLPDWSPADALSIPGALEG
jgi:phosphatidylglycerol---prolipoprotein diacylglyceryl transferase